MMQQSTPGVALGEADEVASVHGTLVEVLGMGVLLTGKSGCGKSDLALGLVDRGHRLIADDQVVIQVVNGQLVGSCPPGGAGFIEIYGLGVVNLARLYGEQVLCQALPLGLVLALKTTDDGQWVEGERLYCQQRDWVYLGVSVKELLLPCGQGRDLPLLVEMAVRLSRYWRQGQQGHDDVTELDVKLSAFREGRS